jgi:hypothetical protein
MPSSESLIRSAETQLHEWRQKNLLHLNEQYGHGFQALLVQLVKQIGKFASSSEISNLVNASKNSDGSMRTMFTSWHARRLEDALDLPMCCLDVPDWHFRNNLDYFWQYAARAAEDRKWFDGLLHRLLEVPAQATQIPKTATESKSTSSIDWAAVRARLEKKRIAVGASKDD